MEVDLEYLIFVEFQNANLPNFRGTFNPHKVEEWMNVMEKVFSVLACIEYKKVAFATYKADT